MKELAIFGSTGSIGCSTLNVVRRERDRFAVSILTAGHNPAVCENPQRSKMRACG